MHPIHHLGVGLVFLLKEPGDMADEVKRLNHPHAAHGFFRQAQNFAHLLLSLTRRGFEFFTDTRHQPHRQRHNAQHHQGERRADGKQRHQKQNHVERVFEKTLNGSHNGPFHGNHVGGHARDEVALALLRKRGEGQLHHAAVKLVSKVANQAAANGRKKKQAQVAKQIGHKGKKEKRARHVE